MKNRSVFIPMVLIVGMLVAFATSCNPTPPQASDDELFVEFSTSLPIASYIANLERGITGDEKTKLELSDDEGVQFILEALLYYSKGTNPRHVTFEIGNAEIKRTIVDPKTPDSTSGYPKTSIYNVQLEVSVPYTLKAESTEDGAKDAGSDAEGEKQKLVISAEIYRKIVSESESVSSLIQMKFSNMVVNDVSYKDVAILFEGASLTSATVGGKEVANKQALLPIVFQFINYGE